MTWPIIITLILVGLILVALEIVALPGAICGICGGAMVAIGIWQTYAGYGPTAGIITLLVSIAVGVIMLALLMKSRTWRRFSLNEQSDSRVNQVGELGIQPGDIGLTLSRLAPAGKARLRGQMVEVHSSGKFIDQGVGIVVTEVEGYRIVVQPLPPESAPQS
ncbi:MAG: hypothetical protein IJM88_05985 [Bacteroidales bacterium]|nr:hypothetical protein [Bacteroidales bacterium]